MAVRRGLWPVTWALLLCWSISGGRSTTTPSGGSSPPSGGSSPLSDGSSPPSGGSSPPSGGSSPSSGGSSPPSGGSSPSSGGSSPPSGGSSSPPPAPATSVNLVDTTSSPAPPVATSRHRPRQPEGSASRGAYPACRMGYVVMDYLPTEGGYYQHQTCYWCYHFVPAHRRKHNLEVVRKVVNFPHAKPRVDHKFRVQNETYHFDPEDVEAWGFVVEAMVDDLEASKLESCCRDALHCCTTSLTHDHDHPPPGVDEVSDGWRSSSHPGDGSGGHCPHTWDGWLCFPITRAGSTITFTCPSHAYKGLPDCSLEGRKTCWANGTWARDNRGVEQTDYNGCSQQAFHLSGYRWESCMHVVSMMALAPAICLIIYYRQLRVQRFYLHLNLFLTLFGKAFFSLLDLQVIRIPEYTGSNSLLDQHTAGCKCLVFFMKFFSLSVWTWMLAESVYLHRVIVAAFRGGGQTYVYLVLGWAPAVVVCVAWAGARAALENTQCWLGDDRSHSADVYLVTELPKLIILIVNTLLLANMTRVLLTKLRGVNTDNSTATRRAVKATVFLLPLFGVHFFSTFFIPPESTSCSSMQVYIFFATCVDGLQGLYVASVYCFLNKEVKRAVRRSARHVRGRFATDRSFATYDPRMDLTLLHSGATANSVVTATSTCEA
ncbi:corticotropin-releasing factor receptor 2-like [Panulirus ornatus]|uniref:corticotropin-releasing factor receptor 2-like n=1 Tax=Panulirus ornatus TaxID=150431 RepID=UPI003A85EA8C